MDIIPFSNIIFEDENKSKDKDELKGFKTLVMWGDGKTKGNGKSRKFPAEIIEVSDNKDYLLKTMREEETFSINTGKRCHKRIHKAKFTIESDSESDEVEHSIPKKLKASRAKKTQACCSASFASLIKE
ncbi:uncharacterized protein LOC124448859 isoform X2 [Xenia sp. Carnegie-2017]|uniref:uncharacterized protein LOC124448859 isoform X2 n=1 Tax=Xenia sp. Carnegie-2017 TaxID=2897299 RepID=UPI001F049ED2|nr:uncharacterized protein LOC124448859 isoform X2 [Xenia sp. Carnegie-2017]